MLSAECGHSSSLESEERSLLVSTRTRRCGFVVEPSGITRHGISQRSMMEPLSSSLSGMGEKTGKRRGKDG